MNRNHRAKQWFNALIFLVFSGTPVFAQKAQEATGYLNFTVEDGLASNETYQVFQDSKGYVWIATDRGVSRYNGYEFENFTTSDGLPDNTVFAFYEDYKHRIWFCTFNGKTGYYYGNKFVNLPIDHPKKHIRAIGVSRKEVLVLEYIGQSKKRIETRYYQIIQTRKGTALKRLKNHDAGAVWLSSKHRIQLEGNRRLHAINKEVILSDQHDEIIWHKITSDYQLSSIVRKDQFIFITSEEGNLLQYDEKTSAIRVVKRLPGAQFTSFLKDRDQGEWFSTLNKGILYKPKQEIRQIRKSGQKATESVTGYWKQKKYALQLDKSNTITIDRKTAPDITFQVPSDVKQLIRQGEELYFSVNNMIYRVNAEGNVSKATMPVLTGINSMVVENNQIWMLGSDCSLRQLGDLNQKSSRELRQIKLYNEIRPRILIRQGALLWIGGMQGLNLYDLSKDRLIRMNNKPWLGSRIEDMALQSNGALMMATRGSGLLIRYEGKVYHIGRKEGLINNILNNLVITDAQTAWVSSHTGISRIRITSFAPFRYEIMNLTREDGLISRQINHISVHGDSVYAATPQGVSVFCKCIRTSQIKPVVVLDRVVINQENKAIRKEYELAYDQNNIIVSFTGLYYPDARAQRYEYTLVNLGSRQKITEQTKNRMVSLLSMAPGNYRLEINSISPKKLKSKQGSVLYFTIQQHPLKRWWVIALMLAGLFGLGYWFLNARIRRLKRELSLRKELKQLENKALRAQINPHFVFNALSAIQHIILKEDKYRAYGYLSSFATLMRSTLNNSENETVSLQEELDLLEKYIELENLRFDQKFNYTVQLDEKIDAEHVRIPAMLIQPYVENAIRHGFMHKKTKGNLQLLFKLHENTLICQVEDDGVGREHAARYTQQMNHQSFAMNINQRRLEIMNEMNREHHTISIEDLYADGKACGTRITLYIPLKP